jgi:uroporphyrinogen-III decarboxylase
MKDYLTIDDRQIARFMQLYARYRRLYTHPDQCEPMFIINSPLAAMPSMAERLADPLAMLKSELEAIRPHLAIEDDRLPTVRVSFGTAQVAAAFGCEFFFPPDSLPCAANHVLQRAEDVENLKLPSLDAGWYGKLWQWTDIWLANLPAGVHIQHPDIQSPFNSAHLVRGNDILMDFYDNPAAVDKLLDLVTDYMIAVTRKAKSQISSDKEWFFDWGFLWKGFARISNCSMHLISPDFYRKHVLPRDRRFLQAVGGGRVHYCGTQAQVIDEYFKLPGVSGLDLDWQLHDLFDIAHRAPAQMVLLVALNANDHKATLERLLAGDWPVKRNLIVQVGAASVDEARRLLQTLRTSWRKHAG